MFTMDNYMHGRENLRDEFQTVLEEESHSLFKALNLLQNNIIELNCGHFIHLMLVKQKEVRIVFRALGELSQFYRLISVI